MEQVLMRGVQRWVAPRAAWIEARDGALWVTRSGDLTDHVIQRGERLAVARGDDLVLQSWRRDQPAVWDWQTRKVRAAAGLSGARQREIGRLRTGLPARARRFAAALLRAVASGLDALAARARRAAANANANASRASRFDKLGAPETPGAAQVGTMRA